MKSTYITWLKVCKHHHIPETDWVLDGKLNVIRFVEGPATGSSIDLVDLVFNPSDPLYERFGSLEYTSGWIEEAGEVHPLGADTIKSRTNRHLNKEMGWKAKLLRTFNPKKNWLYMDVYKPFKAGTLPPTHKFIQALPTDNHYTGEEYLRTISQIKDKAQRERLLGNWNYDDDQSLLIAFEAITDLFTNPEPDESDERFMTVDAARFGSDSIIIACWKGHHAFSVEKFNKLPLVGIGSTRELIRERAIQHRIPYKNILIDETGIGAGLVDSMPGVNGFIGAASPIVEQEPEFKIFGQEESSAKPNYENLRTQCFYLFADRVNTHGMSISCDSISMRDEIIEECEQIKSKDSEKEGKLKIVPKEEMKLNLGRSPDYADALSMRCWFDVARPAKTVENIALPRAGASKVIDEYAHLSPDDLRM